jgi:hypothetical protein
VDQKPLTLDDGIPDYRTLDESGSPLRSLEIWDMAGNPLMNVLVRSVAGTILI